MKRIFCLALLFSFLSLFAFAQTDPPDFDYQILFDMKEGRVPASMEPRDDDIYHYNVTHEDINISIDPTTQIINGTVTMTAESYINNLALIAIDFADNMAVDSVYDPAGALTYNRLNNQIRVTPHSPLNQGQQFQVTVVYHGHPGGGSLQGFTFGSHSGTVIVASLSEPEDARTWWPCKDVPHDKFTADIRYTVPDWMFAASNGVLVDTTHNPGSTITYHWQESYPITTYLISISATNFVHFGEPYISVFGDTMPIDHYVYPERLSQAQTAFATLPNYMAFFETKYGEYPFIEEKYGHALFTWSGGMEHQTMTSIGHNILSTNYEWLYVHELAHMWWGDMVTCGTWMDIWLNEGFATYSDALYKEHAYGTASFRSRMSSFRSTYFYEDQRDRFPIYNPTNMWGGTVYQKGAWLMHMLRWVGGDSAFWEFFPAYRDSFAFESVVSSELQEVFEAVYDTTLDWFFDEWVYQAGFPEFNWGYQSTNLGGNQYRVDVTFRQTQQLINQTPIFTMPLPVEITTTSGAYEFVAWDSLPTQMFSFNVEGQPLAVMYDPDEWILDRRYSVSFFLPDLQAKLVPDSSTLVIPSGGGSFRYTASLTNNSSSVITTDGWTGVVLPNGQGYGPIALRTNLTVPAGVTLTRQFEQNVPPNAPAGEYNFFFLTGSYSDSSTVAADAFRFVKQ